jgi:hypothetical protein
MIGPETAGCAGAVGAVTVGGYASARLAIRPGIVGVGVWPPQILPVLRPSRGHNDWYS